MLLSSHDTLQSDYSTKYYLSLQKGFPGKLVITFGYTTSIQVLGTADSFSLILSLFLSLFLSITVMSCIGRILLSMAFLSDP